MNTTTPPRFTQTTQLYRTDDLPFASYAHASRKLRFIECEVNDTGSVAFVFADPGGAGDQFHLDFESGAECGAAALYDSIRHLRRVMDRTKNTKQRSNEQYDHSSRRR